MRAVVALAAVAAVGVTGFSPTRHSSAESAARSFQLAPLQAQLGAYVPRRHAVHPPAESKARLPHGPYRPVGRIGRASTVRKPQRRGLAGPSDPVTIFRNTDLGDLVSAWEPNVASSGNVVLFTGNWTAGYSTDGGKTFNLLSPDDLLDRAPAVDRDGFADQVVTYVPKYDLFVWIVQSGASKKTNENVYRIAVASPAQIIASKGKSWSFWDLGSKLAKAGTWFDYEDVSVGNDYLYLSCNDVGGGVMAMVRLSLADIAAHASVAGTMVTTKGWWIRPAQNVADRAYFVAHASDSVLRVFAWDESASKPFTKDVPIPTIANSNWVTKLPSGAEWLGPTTKIGSNVQGATVAGKQLWVAWSAARDVVVGGKVEKSWPQPHVEIAVVDTTTFKRIGMRYLWSKTTAFAWPALATNREGEVGISFNFGAGGSQYAYHGVGILTGTQSLRATTYATGPRVAGGHYVGIRPHYPLAECFSAAGFDQFPLGKWNRPHYVLFGRKDAACDPPPARAPVVVTGPATGVGATTATITGTVNPNGSATQWHFEWGTTSSYGNTTPLRTAGSGTSDVAASELLTGLAPGTTYHYQLVGDSPVATSFGGDRTFTTATPPPPPPPAAKLPDLVVSTLTKDSFTVTNRGEAAAGPFAVSLANSKVGTATFSFSGLAAGASVTQSFFCNAGTDTATADSGGTVAESDESNNTATLTVVSCIG